MPCYIYPGTKLNFFIPHGVVKLLYLVKEGGYRYFLAIFAYNTILVKIKNRFYHWNQHNILSKNDV